MGGAPEAVTDLDGVADALRRLRADAGLSFARLSQEVRGRREARGLPASAAYVGRITVYDCFRDGRRRMDDELVGDLFAVLGRPDEEVARWRATVRRLRG